MINPAFMNHREEAALLGDMVIGYGELDITFSHIAGIAINHKYAVLEACHKIRSESARIDIANALAHEAFEQRGLSKEYDHAQTAMRFCLKVRNQYAHAQWASIDGQLKFTNPENAFSRPLKPTVWKEINLVLLGEQERFFENTRMWLLYLEMTLEGQTKRQPVYLNKPPKMQQPNMHTLPLTQAHTQKGKGPHASQK
jgi:hypothetical protein